MKTIPLTLLIAIASLFTACHEAKSPIALQKEILNETTKLERNITSLRDSVEYLNSPQSIARQFKAARLQYKKVEWALEYFMPQILGAPDELDVNVFPTHDAYFRPRNFTYLDSVVQSGKIAENKDAVLSEINSLLDNSRSIIVYLENVELEKDEAVAGIE